MRLQVVNTTLFSSFNEWRKKILSQMTDQQKVIAGIALVAFSLLAIYYLVKKVFLKKVQPLPPKKPITFVPRLDKPISITPEPTTGDKPVSTSPQIKPEPPKQLGHFEEYEGDMQKYSQGFWITGKGEKWKLSGKFEVREGDLYGEGSITFPNEIKFIMGIYNKGLFKLKDNSRAQLSFPSVIGGYDKPYVFGGLAIFEPFKKSITYIIEKGEFFLEDGALNGKGRIILKHKAVVASKKNLGTSFNKFNKTIKVVGGRRKMIEKSSLTYEGSLKKGQAHGDGKMTIQDKQKYLTFTLKGTFAENLLNGTATVIGKNTSNYDCECAYSGIFKNGIIVDRVNKRPGHFFIHEAEESPLLLDLQGLVHAKGKIKFSDSTQRISVDGAFDENKLKNQAEQ